MTEAKFKQLSFDEQVKYLKSTKSLCFMKFVSIAQMKAKIREVYPDQSKQWDLSDMYTVLRCFEQVVQKAE